MSEKNNLQEYCQKNHLSIPQYKSWSKGLAHKLHWWAQVIVNIDNEDIVVDSIVATNSKSSAEKQAAALMFDLIKSSKSNKSKSNNIISEETHLTKLRKYLENTQKKISTSNSSDDNLSNSTDDQSGSESESDTESDTITDIYLIDLENKPAFNLKCKPACLYIGFLNSIHHSLDKYKNWHKCKSDSVSKEVALSKDNFKLLYLVEGGTADLVDHFMTAFIYPTADYVQEIQADTESINIHIISGDHASWCTRACMEKVIKWRQIPNIKIKNSATIH